ncbi:hypothetical protein LTR62_004699 [Meristemomyces frigidus]|uniref:GST N-terminal domain-containing protein n=1 Tax=Meristemomyces frigidus TaxID=1508187 RepID=A0AAN7TDK9_9PEZI|nr:hypothetical protein LTR62_004699 [Meristemomyces frigidus]
MTTSHPIIYYDIASKQPSRTFAPNPWKIRLALNYKGLPYKTQWTNMPDIHSLREGLGIPANRTLPDGTPYHTLPAIQDSATGKLEGDSFAIALYLDSQYPETPRLFRPNTIGLTAAFNQQVDGIFTKHTGLSTKMPFDASIEEEVKAMFVKRVGASKWEDLLPSPEERAKDLVSLEAALEELAKAYQHTGGTTDWVWRARGTATEQKQVPGREEAGVLLDGGEPVYADFIVGAWVKMFEACMADEDWEKMRGWQGGLWGRVADYMERFAEMK